MYNSSHTETKEILLSGFRKQSSKETRYGLTGGGDIFLTFPERPWGPLSLL